MLLFLTVDVVELLMINKRIPNSGRRYYTLEGERATFTNNPDTWVYRASLHHLGISSISMFKELLISNSP